MHYLSKVFQPIITIPKGAKIKNTEITCKSQKLLLECGLVRPTASGLLALLPLARRALHKLERLCRRALEDAGAQEVSLPALSPAALWRASGRDSLPDLWRLRDRHNKEFLLAPTHEESITDLLADVGPLSYKQLPLLLYQVSSKYRDERRPKHGLLRAREFLMLDAYGAAAGEAAAGGQYRAVGDHLAALFRRLRLPVHRVSAECGDMGGAMSHEWQLAAPAGEDALAVCPSCSHAQRAALSPSRSHAERARCAACGSETNEHRAIEVAHTFVLGERYSAALGAGLVGRGGDGAGGRREPLHMSCYGIGLSRLLAAAVETLSEDNALRWPEDIAPYHTVVVTPKEGSREWEAGGEGVARAAAELAGGLAGGRGDVLVDDRAALTVGARLVQAEKMGYPCVLVAGRGCLESPPRVELRRPSAPPRLLALDQLAACLRGDHDQDTA